MAKMQKKSLNSPDETDPFDNGKVELANLTGVTIDKATDSWKYASCLN
jgi:hypothetical protein